MRNVWLIWRKEMRSYFVSPIAYILLLMCALIFGFFFWSLLQAFLQFSMIEQLDDDVRMVVAPARSARLYVLASRATPSVLIEMGFLSNRQDEAFLVDFSSEAYIDQDFTSSIEKLQQGLAYIKSSGGTAMYDAVIASADYLSKNAKRSKQVLLIVTDGDDNASSGTLEQTIRRVQDLDGPAIYCIGLLFGEDVSHSEARHSREVLTELSAQTGGQAYFPRSMKEVDGIAREVAQDIRQQYTIEYRSTKSPELGGYRQIHVEAKEKGYRGLQVRTRPGYFPKVTAGGGRSETSGK